MDAEWLRPISLGGAQSQEKHLWRKETNDDRERGVATQQEEDSGSRKQYQTQVKTTANLELN